MFRRLTEITGHAGAIYSCSYDGTFIYTGGADKFVARWNLETGTQDKFAIRFEQSVYSVLCVEDRLFVGLSNGDLHVFDLAERKELRYFTQHKEAIFSISYNQEKGQVYVGDAAGNLSVWDAKTLELMIYLPLNAGKIRDIAVAPGGSRFALSCQDETIRIFESDHFNEIQTLKGHREGATSSVFLNDTILISGGKDAMLRKWDLTTGQQLKEVPAHYFAIYRLATLGDQLLSVSRDKTIKIFTMDLDFVQRLDAKEGGHRHSVNDLVLMDDFRFATCGDDKRILVWSES